MSDYDVMRRLLSARPIAFHPELAIVLGGIHEALMFQQLAYWSDKGSDTDGWIYKTTEQFRQETTINRYQQDKARANLVSKKVIEAKRRGLPAKMHYKINWNQLYELLSKPVCSPSTNCEDDPPNATEPVCSPSTNLIDYPEQALLETKTTAKTTQRDNGPSEDEKSNQTEAATHSDPVSEVFHIPEIGISSTQFWHTLLAAAESGATFSRAEIETWLRPSRLAGRDGDVLVIAASSVVARDRLDARMLPQLRAVAATTFGAPVAFRVVVA